MNINKAISQSTPSLLSASLSSVTSGSNVTGFVKHLIAVDSSTVKGRFIQRLRLVGLQFVPVVIFLGVCIQQLIVYTTLLQNYKLIYEQDQIRYTVASLVLKLGNERSAQAYQYLTVKSGLESPTVVKNQSLCAAMNSTHLGAARNETDKLLTILSNLPWSSMISHINERPGVTYQLFNVTTFRAQLSGARLVSIVSDCDAAYSSMLFKYSQLLYSTMSQMPDLYEADLNKITFMHVFALRDILDAHDKLSSLCYLAFEFFNNGRFLSDSTRYSFVSNLSVGESAMSSAVAMDNNLMTIHNELAEKRNFTSENFKKIVDSNGCDPGFFNCNFSKWYESCEAFAKINEILSLETIQGEQENGIGVEWSECVAGIVVYTLAILLNIPVVIFIYMNSEMTIQSLKQFSVMFNNQAKELLAEKDRTEILLSEMLPKSVAHQLRLGNIVDAETYEVATIYFSDIVDFNDITLLMEPMKVVTILNSIYNLLDSRIECYDVYKVETIGSVYMVVSGVPARNGQQHVTEVAEMSLDILATMEQQSFADVPRKVELRIGIHTGPCVAGVVGNKMTRYCLFGDAVNTASRMQSTGLESTFSYLEDSKNYVMEKRGTVEVKGKGSMTTYWLISKKIE